jgi:hypothetical protein
MDRFGQLFLAQAVTSMRDLKNIVGHGLWVLVILCYAYVVVLIIMALLRDHVDGSWKYTLARGIAVTGVATILLAIFFPGQSVTRARLTRPKKAEMRSTLKCELKTHSGVLPQLRTLEVPVDATGKVKPGTTGTGSLRATKLGFNMVEGRVPHPRGTVGSNS